MITTGTNCTITRLGTGTEPCQVNEGVASGFIAVPKGWSLLKSSGTFNKAYVDEMIQTGVFVPFTNAFNSAPTTPDPVTEESQLGVTIVTRQGLPMYVFTYKRGYAFHRSAYSYNSQNEYDFIITYSEEVVKVAESADGLSIKGFSGGMLNTAGYKENDGSISAQSTTSFQLTSSKEYNQLGVFITDLDFLPSLIDGVIDSVFTGSADVSAGKVYLDPVWAGNETYPTTGLAIANLALTLDGVADTIASMTYSDGRYTITPTTLPLTLIQNVRVKTKSVSPTSDVAKVGNKFYKGDTGNFNPGA